MFSLAVPLRRGFSVQRFSDMNDLSTERDAVMPRGRLLAGILGLFAAALIVGSLAAPAVFNLLIWLGRNFQSLESLRDIEFERVASRSVLLVALFSVYPAMRLCRLNRFSDLGFRREAGWWKLVASGLLIGAASVVVPFLFGWATGAYVPRSELQSGLAGKLAGYLVGALLVGVIEEGLFRGAIFGVLRRGMGFWGGAILASVVFSLVHFAKPEPPAGVVYGHWNSGLDLLPHLFNTLTLGYHCFPLAVTLFMMGMALCAFYDRAGNLYFVIGLHAGWVWVMRIGTYFFDRNDAVLGGLFGESEIISKSVIALILVSLFFVGALVRRRGRGRRDELA